MKQIVITFFCAILFIDGYSQFDYKSNGNITYEKKVIAEVNSLRSYNHDVCLINKATNDTIAFVEFIRLRSDSEFVRFTFVKENKVLEVDHLRISLVKRGVAKFFVNNNLLDQNANIVKESLDKTFAEYHKDYAAIQVRERKEDVIFKARLDSISPIVDAGGLVKDKNGILLYRISGGPRTYATYSYDVHNKSGVRIAFGEFKTTYSYIQLPPSKKRNRLSCDNFNVGYDKAGFTQLNQCIANYLVSRGYF
jgi:hypothetical protein